MPRLGNQMGGVEESRLGCRQCKLPKLCPPVVPILRRKLSIVSIRLLHKKGGQGKNQLPTFERGAIPKWKKLLHRCRIRLTGVCLCNECVTSQVRPPARRDSSP